MLVDELSDQTTTRSVSDGARVVDLRGFSGSGRAAAGVLEDPTGIRRRWMARIARASVLLLAAWVVALLLGGLGLFPTGAVPLGPAVDAALSPPAPAPGQLRAPAGSSPARHDADVDGRSARRAAPARKRPSTSSSRGQGRRRPPSDPRGTRPAPTGLRGGPPGTATPAAPRRAPGAQRTAPARPTTPAAPATLQTPRGKNSEAPGQTRTAPGPTTAPGQSGTARGRTVAPVATPAGSDRPTPHRDRTTDPATRVTTSK
jgi:hypothetical protein